MDHILVILDKSGSMSPLQEETISGFNQFIEEQRQVSDDAIVSLVTFSYGPEVVYDKINIDDVEDLDKESYKPSGYTALLDAIGTGIRLVGNHWSKHPNESKDVRVITCIMTDGFENNSREYNEDTIANMIKDHTDNFGWEFIYLGANQDSFSVAGNLNINLNNVDNYEASAVGTKIAYKGMSNMVTRARSNS